MAPSTPATCQKLSETKTLHVLENGRAYRVIDTQRPRINRAGPLNASDLWEGGIIIQLRQNKRWVYLDTAETHEAIADCLKAFARLPRLPEQEESLESLQKE